MFKEVDVDWPEYSPEDREDVRQKVKEALDRIAANPPPPEGIFIKRFCFEYTFL